jgi:hypothetical protein
MSGRDHRRQGQSRPLSIRFNEAEKAALQERAGGLPLGTYIKAAVLGDDAKAVRGQRTPVKDADLLCRVLALLGQSRLANNLNQLAKAANQGSLPVTPETEDDIRRACAAVFEMRLLLLQALGKRILDTCAEVRA